MKFWAMFKKEFREILPWVLIGSVVFSISIGYQIQDAERESKAVNVILFYILSISALFGGLAGVLHYWREAVVGTDVFTIHRSITKLEILIAKFTAVIAGYLCFLIQWYSLYRIGLNIVSVYAPWNSAIFAKGGLALFNGLIFYLGIALSGVANTKLKRVVYFFFIMIVYVFLLNSKLGIYEYSLFLSVTLAFMFVGLMSNYICRELK